MSEIEKGGVVVPQHPHLKDLRRKRRDMLKVALVEEGKRVGGMRAENEVLVRILRDDTGDLSMENLLVDG
jgi:hypothetical protein